MPMEAPPPIAPRKPVYDAEKQQEAVVKKFADLLCNKKKAQSTGQRSELTNLFSKSVTEDEVVLTLPSLDMSLADESGTNKALPKIGENKEQTLSTLSVTSYDMNRPSMTASVLTAASNEAAKVEHEAAKNLNTQTSWTKSTIVYASHAVASNVSDFFSNLIDSRLRAWTLLLLRHSLSTGDAESRSRLLSMLSAKLKVTNVVTFFRTLPLPETAASQPKEADVVLPLLLEVVIHLTVQGKDECVTLRSPGTISAYFDTDSNEQECTLKKVSVKLDTGIILSAMVDQARILVFKAVASATKTPLPLNTDDAAEASHPISENAQSHIVATNALSGFRSALNLTSSSTSDRSPRLQKAQSSALRLNSILHRQVNERVGLDINALGIRRVRSVKWDTPLQLPKLNTALAPNPKKQRIAQNAAKLKSFKSFGRPHAGDFGSGPRNATFGEFGDRTYLWGRDGRLAQHPMPMQSNVATSDNIGLTGITDRNATFDLSKFGKGLKAVTATSSTGLPRTATVLEQWLVSRSTSGSA